MDVAGGSRNGISTDLFYEFMKAKNGESGAENDEEMELNLGLSTNGRFGVDPMRENLRRSSSSSDVVVTDNSVGNGKARAVAFGSDAPLVRASSLPSEFQTRLRELVVQNPRSLVVNEHGNSSAYTDGNRLHVDANGIPRLQEATHNPMTRGSSSHQFPQVPVAQERAVERPAGAATNTVETNGGYIRSPTNDMPYVTTRGFGPKNEQVKGFLYRYRRGEDVKIVCVCHGLFLSPAEFVKHGGGGDVHNPLKHIVVTPFPVFE